MLLLRPARLTALAAASLLLAGILAASSPAAAESEGPYHLGMLSEAQRADLFRRIDSYAVVEVFLNACGRRPALESRVRRIVAGCIRAASLNTITAHYRQALASRAALRWDCHSANGRRMIARSEHAIRLTIADLSRYCRPGG
jgi:hypothetical protein